MTTTPSFEASSSGLKMSYLRFISDSAPGFVVLLLIGFVWPLPWWLEHSAFGVLFAALFFLLATPVGLAINAVSYFLVGNIQTNINRICFLSQHWPMRDARRSLMVSQATEHFGFTADDWPERNQVYGELVEGHLPDLAARIEHLRGLKRFARSVALLSFACFFFRHPMWASGVVVAVGIAGALSGTRKPRELWPLIAFVLVPLTVSALFIDVICKSVDILALRALAIALTGLLIAGMIDFYQRATIAMYLHIECPLSIREDLTEIRDALFESAKRLRPDLDLRPAQSQSAPGSRQS